MRRYVASEIKHDRAAGSVAGCWDNTQICQPVKPEIYQDHDNLYVPV